MNDQNRPRFFLYGGSFLKRMGPYISTHIGDVVGSIIGPSPLSEEALREDMTCDPWLIRLDAALDALKADYLLLDLQRADSILMTRAGKLISPMGVIEPGDTFPDGMKMENPMRFSEEKRGNLMRKFSSVLLKHFAPSRIILLHTPCAQYFMTGNYIQPMQYMSGFQYSEKEISWLKSIESSFIQKTSCFYVDISRFYFYQKEIGRPYTTTFLEPYCYEDTIRCIRMLLQGESCPQRPDFSLSLTRYSTYWNSLHKKAFEIFLDRSYFLDHLILSASSEFVKVEYANLIALNSLDWNSPETAMVHMYRLNLPAEIYRIVTAFDALLRGDYHSCPEEDYSLLFQKGIVPEELMELLREQSAQWGLHPKQIKRNNAGYYFARMTGYHPEKFITAETVIEPVLVNVFGSCISRDSLSIDENDTAVNRYWFHVPAWETHNPPVSYPPDLFPENPFWTARLTKLQFDKGVFQEIRASEGSWLLVDLFFLTNPNLCRCQGAVYADFGKRYLKRLGAESVKPWIDSSVLGTFTEIMSLCEDWCNLVLERYGKNIILINGIRSRYWRGDDGKFYCFSFSGRTNPFMQRAFQWFAKRLNCYTINLFDRFITDDAALVNKAPSHKNNFCYQLQHNLIMHIIHNKPEQKHYDAVPGRIYVDHILRYAPENSLYAMEQVFHHTFLDALVLRLDYGLLAKYKNEIAAIYDADYPDSETLLQTHDFGENTELRKAFLYVMKNSQEAQPTEIPSTYAPYKSHEKVYWDRVTNYLTANSAGGEFFQFNAFRKGGQISADLYDCLRFQWSGFGTNGKQHNGLWQRQSHS